MSLTSRHDGYYDTNGRWRKLKHCFVYCGDDRCTCRPPFGVYQKPQKEETETKEEIRPQLLEDINYQHDNKEE